MKPIITLAMLRANGACTGQVALFEQTFGDTVTVTVAAARNVADKFDWVWAASHFLTAAAGTEYQRVRAAAYTEYERVTAAAYAEYERVVGPTWAEYERVRAAAYAEYERVRAAAYTEYRRVRAAAFASAYIAQCKEGLS